MKDLMQDMEQKVRMTTLEFGKATMNNGAPTGTSYQPNRSSMDSVFQQVFNQENSNSLSSPRDQTSPLARKLSEEEGSFDGRKVGSMTLQEYIFQNNQA